MYMYVATADYEELKIDFSLRVKDNMCNKEI